MQTFALLWLKADLTMVSRLWTRLCSDTFSFQKPQVLHLYLAFMAAEVKPAPLMVVQKPFPWSNTYLYPNILEIGIPAGYSLTTADKATYGAQWKRGAAFFGDAVEHYPRRKVVSAYASNNITAYSYRFNVQPAGLSNVIGVTHDQEVAWVFDNINGDGVFGWGSFESVETLMFLWDFETVRCTIILMEISRILFTAWTVLCGCLGFEPYSNDCSSFRHYPAYSICKQFSSLSPLISTHAFWDFEPFGSTR